MIGYSCLGMLMLFGVSLAGVKLVLQDKNRQEISHTSSEAIASETRSIHGSDPSEFPLYLTYHC